MEIINFEKIVGHKRIVLVGRPKNVRAVAKYMKAILLHCPRRDDYFMDYPMVVKELQDYVQHEPGVVIVTTQSKEFLDCLLESDFDFMLATVRKNDHEDDIYRLRVVTKEYALQCRESFDMEFRC